MDRAEPVARPVEPGRWPLIGRAAELERVHRAVSGPEPTAVLISGEAGIGKSRLAAEVCGTATAGGRYVVVGRANRATQHLAGIGISRLTDPPSIAHATVSVRSIADRLRDRAEARPIVVVIDEVDHLDDTSARILRQLSGLVDLRLVLLSQQATLADGPLAGLVDEVRLDSIRLPGLARTAVRDLLTSVLGQSIDELSARRIWSATAGSPFLIGRLVSFGLEQHRLVERRGMWQWQGEVIADSIFLGDLFAGELNRLDPAESQVLAWLALTDELPVEVLEKLAGPLVLAGLAKRGLTAVVEDRVRATRPLQQAALQAGLGALRRRRLFRELIAASAAVGVPARLGLQYGWWEHEADLPTEPERAARLAAAALGEGLPGLAERLASHRSDETTVVRAQAQIALGTPTAAEQTLATMRGPDLTADSVGLRALNLAWGLGRIADATAVLRRGRAAFEPGQAAALAVAQAGVDLCSVGSGVFVPPQARGDVQPLFDAAADLIAVQGDLSLARPLRVRERLARKDLRARAPWPAVRGALQAFEVRALIQTGDLIAAEALSDQYYADALSADDQAGVTVLGHAVAACASWAGDHERAWPVLREARALLDDAVPFPLRVEIRSDYAAAAAAVGRLDLAVAELDELQRLEVAGALCDRIDFARIRMLCHSGRRAYAADLADQLADRCLTACRWASAIEAGYYQVRLNPSLHGARRLLRAVGETDSDLFRMFADHATALVGRNGRTLLRLADEFGDRGYLGLALVMGESALQAPATYTVRTARKREVAESRARWGGGTQYSAIGGPATGGGPLTSREREACELAASGLRNEAIATSLGISVRTVTNLLARAYQKLGVSSRRQLQTAMSLSAMPDGR
ncbi:helix-turn-helix transcriptional regulator [Kribbella sp. CA-293567]|uniref:helix-turn-helix transcriptional regulator n=1 Tax=Kribbella sp. CA-293567 TaxID=3002436 RepID=UPI0022DE8A76|nr:LuxR family transcriptional regulator [Kribbella sp. CA-293567]WBQ03612.1 LuxR C-terminal-related transcriptional regulator [Kribbella sp. CA-293567]